MTNQFPHPFHELQKKFKDYWRKLPMKVSGIALKEFKENFDRQGYRSNAGGIIKWDKRKHNKNEREASRAILIKSGRLKRGLRARPTNEAARVINEVPYAKIMNEGGVIQHPAHERKLFFRRIRGGKVRFARERVARYGQKIQGKAYKIKILPRPYMITVKPLIEDINKTVITDANEIFKSVK